MPPFMTYTPAAPAAAASGIQWYASLDALTTDDVYDISADGGATALVSIDAEDGKIAAEVDASGVSGLQLQTYDAAEDFEIAARINSGFATDMSDGSHNLSVGLVCALRAAGAYAPINDDWKGAVVRTSTATTSTTIGMATRTTDGDAWLGSESNLSAGATYWNTGPYNFVLQRSGNALRGWIADDDGALIHRVFEDLAFGNGAARVIARIDNAGAVAGHKLFIHRFGAVTISNGVITAA